MPSFLYKAYGSGGELAEGRIQALSADAADALLGRRGLTAFKLTEVSQHTQPWWQRDLLSKAGPNPAYLAAFAREFADLYKSGVALDDCLRILAEQSTARELRQACDSLLEDLLNGATLSGAMAERPSTYPGDFINIVRAGETSGTLGLAFEELARLLERRQELNAKIKSALTYPAILLVLAMVSIAIVIGALVPSIAPIFQEGGKPMPGALLLLVTLADNWGFVAIGMLALGGAGLACWIGIRRSPARRLAFDAYRLRLPVIGMISLSQDTANFQRTLGTLLRAGVSLLEASMSAQAVIRNRLLATKVERAVGFIREGRPLAVALRDEGVFPPAAIRMMAIGEETGKLDEMLLRSAAVFEDRALKGIDRAMALLTPALTLSVAVVVGGLVLTVMMAILSINDVVGR
ncbi:type II secretion system F family protein [Bradyrhizobium yuanmingense]|uniref:type II secretion system F family protein n=1 Tax=Bradyrhizobium yuanmingense TaxID=108015 RepID=UPI0004AFBD5A|nr:type II secretion system F family protein [Bradyrhizobium yuanmingense]